MTASSGMYTWLTTLLSLPSELHISSISAPGACLCYPWICLLLETPTCSAGLCLIEGCCKTIIRSRRTLVHLYCWTTCPPLLMDKGKPKPILRAEAQACIIEAPQLPPPQPPKPPQPPQPPLPPLQQPPPQPPPPRQPPP